LGNPTPVESPLQIVQGSNNLQIPRGNLESPFQLEHREGKLSELPVSRPQLPRDAQGSLQEPQALVGFFQDLQGLAIQGMLLHTPLEHRNGLEDLLAFFLRKWRRACVHEKGRPPDGSQNNAQAREFLNLTAFSSGSHPVSTREAAREKTFAQQTGQAYMQPVKFLHGWRL
jgi:hypothetical protein